MSKEKQSQRTHEVAAPRLERHPTEQRTRQTKQREAPEQADMEQVERLRERLAQESPKRQKMLYGDFAASEKRGNQILLTEEENEALNNVTDVFFEEVRSSDVATTVGYPVAGAYDTHVQGWTTRSMIGDVNGKRVFVLCNYPNAWKRRMVDRTMEALSGDAMRKPKPEMWKQTVERRSRIPIIAGTREDMVVMPYIECMNANDLFVHQKEMNHVGPFVWAKDVETEEKIDLLKGFVRVLHEAHQDGETWGEAILPNFALTKNKEPILLDPETTYEGISLLEQRATDLRNMMTSVCGALSRIGESSRWPDAIRTIVDAYPDMEVKRVLRQLCEQPLSARKRAFFNIFTKYRIGSADLEEFDRVRSLVRSIVI